MVSFMYIGMIVSAITLVNQNEAGPMFPASFYYQTDIFVGNASSFRTDPYIQPHSVEKP